MNSATHVQLNVLRLPIVRRCANFLFLFFCCSFHELWLEFNVCSTAPCSVQITCLNWTIFIFIFWFRLRYTTYNWNGQSRALTSLKVNILISSVPSFVFFHSIPLIQLPSQSINFFISENDWFRSVNFRTGIQANRNPSEQQKSLNEKLRENW